jgi:3-hydroxyacyl-[acyl-carrier-protein] dehydratase
MRFLMCDRILKLEIGKRVVGLKNITLSEDYFTDHFPIYPIMPGALILEASAQVCEILIHRTVKEQNGKDMRGVLATINKAKFRRFIRPGDQLIIEGNLDSMRGDIAKVSVEVKVKDKIVATMSLIFALIETELLADPITARWRDTTRDFLDNESHIEKMRGSRDK